MPYICLRRTDMGDALSQGTFYVGDLTPNAGQKILHAGEPVFGIDPTGNNVEPSAYAGPIIPVATSAGSTVVTENPGDGSGITVVEYTGLSAFLLDNCVDGTDDGSIGVNDANAAAITIVAAMRTGAASTSATLEVLLQAEDGQITVAASESQNAGFVAGVLRCLAGATYTVPAATEIFAAGGANTAAGGSFSTADTRRSGLITLTDTLTESIRVGQLAGFIAAGFSYLGTASAAVVVYDDDGSVLS